MSLVNVLTDRCICERFQLSEFVSLGVFFFLLEFYVHGSTWILANVHRTNSQTKTPQITRNSQEKKQQEFPPSQPSKKTSPQMHKMFSVHRHYLVEKEWKWDSISQSTLHKTIPAWPHVGARTMCRHGECKGARLLWTCQSLSLCTTGKSGATVSEKGIDRC